MPSSPALSVSVNRQSSLGTPDPQTPERALQHSSSGVVSSPSVAKKGSGLLPNVRGVYWWGGVDPQVYPSELEGMGEMSELPAKTDPQDISFQIILVSFFLYFLTLLFFEKREKAL